MNTVLNDLENGHIAYVELQDDEEDNKIGILRDITYISNMGDNCSCCGGVNSIFEVADGSLACNECCASWYPVKVEE